MKKTFPLSLEIYDQEKIFQALEDFSEVSSCEFSGAQLTISGDTETEIREVFQEFMNYVLSL